jgi:hypothetical protein
MVGAGRKKKDVSTSIDELEKSKCTVLKPMKLISYEADYNMINVEMVVVDHGL